MKSDFDGWDSARTFATEAGSLALQGLMFGFGYAPSRYVSRRVREQRTLVFVHGLAANRASLYPLAGTLRLRGLEHQLSFNHRSGPSIEALAVQLKRTIDAQVGGGRVDLVCHSLGGLVGRAYLQLLGGDRRVDRLVTVGTPHLGTHMTSWMPVPLVRQMAVGSPFLEHLNGLPAPDVECWSFGAERDLIVLPVDSARAPFGHYERVAGVGHTSILLSPLVHRKVGAFLA